MPKYSIYLIGFSMLIMLIAIIVLAVALHLAIKKKSVFGLTANNKQYVRQESSGVTPLYNAGYDEQNKNNGSTLTVNSGIIEISEPRPSEPVTPTRLEEIKVVYAKKPLRPLGPVMPKGQMDAICKEVLRKVQKTDSASFRDLNELLKFEKKDDPFVMTSEDIKESEKENKSEDIKESEKENKSEDKPIGKIDSPFFKLKGTNLNLEQPNIKLETEKDNKPEIKEVTKQETKTEATNETKTKLDKSTDIKIEANTVGSDKNEDESDSETEYDTVPNPIRFRHSDPESDQPTYDTVPNRYRHSGPELELCDEGQYDTITRRKMLRVSGADTDDGLDDIPVYDLPPTRDENGGSKNVIQMDPDTEYLMPFTKEKTDSCYVNAKTH